MSTGIVTRQADGVYVGGNTLTELYDHLTEVLQRFRDASLTVKPSKFVINPDKIILFGWEKTAEGWRPLSHTISPLVSAEPPTTVKQLRSWLGAAKQVSQCIPNYAPIFSPLETTTGGRGSSEQAGPNSSGNASRGLGFALYLPFFKAQHRLRLCFKLCQSTLHRLGFAVENFQELR